MAGVSYWQLGCDAAMHRQDKYIPAHATADVIHGRITKEQYNSFFNGLRFGYDRYFATLREIEDGKLARSQQGDSNKSPSQDGGIQAEQPQ